MSSKESENLKLPGNWYSIDFHIHSPASHDYEDGKDDAAYIRLLERAKEADVDILIITDHDDIFGYKQFLRIEDDLLRTTHTLEKNNTPVPENIRHQTSLFKEIALLPGSEIDVYPNVHLLVAFDPEHSMDEIDDFLKGAGFPQEIRGAESAARYAKWNVQEALLEIGKFNAVAIAAHCDSDKGLYEVTKDWGQNRIAAFTDENLYAMEFISPIARDQIENIMKSPAYERKTHLAFVQSSDFHGKPNQTPGERRTYIRLDSIKKSDKSGVFQAILRALRNSDEYISAPGRPELQDILKKLADKPAIQGIETESDMSLLLQYVCAYANSEDGTIVIGRNQKGNWVGFNLVSENDISNQIASIISTKITPLPNISIQTYPYYSSNYIATVRIRKQPHIFTFVDNDKVYLIEKGKPIQASSAKIVELAESQIIQRYSHLSITGRLSVMSKKLSGLEDSIDILPIVRKIDGLTVPVKKVFSAPKLGNTLTSSQQEKAEFSLNGLAQGNTIILQRMNPRFAEQYLRLSAPCGNLDPNNENYKSCKKFSGQKIIVVPGGGVFFDNQNDVAICCEHWEPLIFSEFRDEYQIDLRFVAAYLKSSTAIWYADRCIGSYDIRNKNIIQELPIPVVEDKSLMEEVVTLVDTLLFKERNYLDSEIENYRFLKSTKDEAEKDKYLEILKSSIELHNKEAEEILVKIERSFYTYFKFSDEEILSIERGLKAASLRVFSHMNLLDD